ncbi:ABC transporter permease [Paenibacillus radicis (ex Gao et al. 2016)]|uniref:Glutathione ABC transporter permease n=1 Tax=Paenibacillus radicis (ex Gao et al. 2016) TaxID=1737354 RepID=A0A917H5C3_9BACL|nr:ABC transporter permease [Paenibacillus radicis (ex Gao et al. 2016)]GGG68103.1 glutathione ABC transporter permease [Paenibacillus radicis (ex Gao et al. 2016)]
MLKVIVNRLLISIVVLLGTLTLVFSLLHLLPGDPVNIKVAGNPVSAEVIANLRHEFGLDQPLYKQYFQYIGKVLHGDFGKSLIDNEDVMVKLMAQFPATISLTLLSMVIAIVLGVLLGVLSAVYRYRSLDHLIRLISLFGISMPTFWVAILLVLIFSVHWQWLPASGVGGFQYVILPAASMGIVGAGLIARMVRGSMLEAIHEPFVRTLRAKGLPERTVIYQHVLRNALIPAVTMIGMLLGELLAGAVVIESVFARQGIGRVILDAIMAKDLPVVQGAILLTASLYIIVNLLVDLSYTIIDPRVRES